jgi:hypothetical protein
LRLHDGRYECVHCNVILDIPVDERPIVTISAASGRPNVRILKMHGVEIHRCEVRTREPAR